MVKYIFIGKGADLSDVAKRLNNLPEKFFEEDVKITAPLLKFQLVRERGVVLEEWVVKDHLELGRARLGYKIRSKQDDGSNFRKLLENCGEWHLRRGEGYEPYNKEGIGITLMNPDEGVIIHAIY